MKMQKLLFVTDFEELWFDALQSLMELRKCGLNHVVFLHVIEREKVAMRRGIGYMKGEATKLKEMANIRFIDWAENLFESGMEVGSYILVGDWVPKVIHASGEEGADLIVTGNFKKSKLGGLLVDKETIHLARRTTTPLLIHKFKVHGKTNDKPFTKPLLATDWSRPSEIALDILIGLKNIVNELVVVHTINEKEVSGKTTNEIHKIQRENRKRLEQICDHLEHEGIKSQYHLYIGEAEEEILKSIKEYQASMVVAGTTGKGAWKEKWLGSVSHKLAEKAEVPVLLVPKSAS